MANPRHLAALKEGLKLEWRKSAAGQKVEITNLGEIPDRRGIDDNWVFHSRKIESIPALDSFNRVDDHVAQTTST